MKINEWDIQEWLQAIQHSKLKFCFWRLQPPIDFSLPVGALIEKISENSLLLFANPSILSDFSHPLGSPPRFLNILEQFNIRIEEFQKTLENWKNTKNFISFWPIREGYSEKKFIMLGGFLRETSLQNLWVFSGEFNLETPPVDEVANLPYHFFLKTLEKFSRDFWLEPSQVLSNTLKELTETTGAVFSVILRKVNNNWSLEYGFFKEKENKSLSLNEISINHFNNLLLATEQNPIETIKGDIICQDPKIQETIILPFPYQDKEYRILGLGFKQKSPLSNSYLSSTLFYYRTLLNLGLNGIQHINNTNSKIVYDRFQEDLEAAIITQKSILSLEFPENILFNVSSYYKPQGKIGGDIISNYKIKDKIYIFFGDVSGHGISSAMVSGMVVLSFMNLAKLNKKPKDILYELNNDLQHVVKTHHIAAAVTCFDLKKKKIIYSYAGHPPIILVRNGELMELEAMNSPLLTMSKIYFYDKKLNLLKGDRLVFFSDGCYEVFNSQNQLLGYHRFVEIIKKFINIQEPKEFIQKIATEVEVFCSNNVQDDMAMLVVDIK